MNSIEKNMLAVNNLCFSYEPQKNLLENISFSIETPGFHSLFGKSGIGKTTLAKLLSGIIPMQIGEIINLNQRVVLYCYDNERLPLWQSVGKHLEEVTPDSNRDLMFNLIRIFGLSRDILTRYPCQLSTGQLNRLNLLRYLTQNFDLLILDETLSNVDEPTKLTILGAIKENLITKTILYISHHLQDVVVFSKSILCLRTKNNKVELEKISGLDRYIYEPSSEVANCMAKVLKYA